MTDAICRAALTMVSYTVLAEWIADLIPVIAPSEPAGADLTIASSVSTMSLLKSVTRCSTTAANWACAAAPISYTLLRVSRRLVPDRLCSARRVCGDFADIPQRGHLAQRPYAVLIDAFSRIEMHIREFFQVVASQLDQPERRVELGLGQSGELLRDLYHLQDSFSVSRLARCPQSCCSAQ